MLATRRAMRARLATEGEGVKPSLSTVERAVDVEVNAEKITFKPKTFFTRGSRESKSWSYGSPASSPLRNKERTYQLSTDAIPPGALEM